MEARPLTSESRKASSPGTPGILPLLPPSTRHKGNKILWLFTRMLQTQIQSSCVCSKSSDALNYPSRPPSCLPIPSPHFLSYPPPPIYSISKADNPSEVREEEKRRPTAVKALLSVLPALSHSSLSPFSSLVPSIHKSTRV